jgi:hypothetical protein
VTGATPEGAKLAAVCHFSIQVYAYFDISVDSSTASFSILLPSRIIL